MFYIGRFFFFFMFVRQNGRNFKSDVRLRFYLKLRGYKLYLMSFIRALALRNTSNIIVTW